ncbi:MAG: tetratricopeptide repeat protein [Ignavibacteriae bacterium]|nr:tetratricopeptide repeat protein [Ignavibacteriota bacterium]
MKNVLRNIITATVLVLIFQTGVFAQVDKAIEAAKRGDYVTALGLFKSAGKIDGYEENYWYGKTLFETGSLKDAEKYYKVALKDDDEGWEALKGMGDLLSYQKKYDDANNYYKKAAKANDENISILIAQGRNLSKAGKLEDAVVVLTRATTISKNNADVYAGLGDAYFYGGAIPAALDNYSKSLQIKDNAAAHYGLGNVYFVQNKFQESVEEFQDAVQLDRKFADAYLQLGKLLYYNEDYTAALNAIEEYNKLKPGDLDGLSYKAKILYGQRKYDEADKVLDEVLKLDPNNVVAFKYKGYVKSGQKQYDEAIVFFQKVPDDYFEPDDYIIYAETYEKLGDFPKAYATFEKGIARDPKSSRLELEYGDSYLTNKDYSNALTHFIKAEQLGSTNAIIYKGLAYFNMGQYEDAIKAFDDAIVINDEYAITYLLRGSAKQALGDRDGAVADYQKVLELDPGNEDAQKNLEILQNMGNAPEETNKTPDGQ